MTKRIFCFVSLLTPFFYAISTFAGWTCFDEIGKWKLMNIENYGDYVNVSGAADSGTPYGTFRYSKSDSNWTTVGNASNLKKGSAKWAPFDNFKKTDKDKCWADSLTKYFTPVLRKLDVCPSHASLRYSDSQYSVITISQFQGEGSPYLLLFLFDRKNHYRKILKPTENLGDKNFFETINGVIRVGDEIWFGIATYGEICGIYGLGVYKYSGRGDTLVRVFLTSNLGVDDDAILCIMKENDNVWFGSRNGIKIYNFKSKKWKHYNISSVAHVIRSKEKINIYNWPEVYLPDTKQMVVKKVSSNEVPFLNVRGSSTGYFEVFFNNEFSYCWTKLNEKTKILKKNGKLYIIPKPVYKESVNFYQDYKLTVELLGWFGFNEIFGSDKICEIVTKDNNKCHVKVYHSYIKSSDVSFSIIEVRE